MSPKCNTLQRLGLQGVGFSLPGRVIIQASPDHPDESSLSATRHNTHPRIEIAQAVTYSSAEYNTCWAGQCSESPLLISVVGRIDVQLTWMCVLGRSIRLQR